MSTLSFIENQHLSLTNGHDNLQIRSNSGHGSSHAEVFGIRATTIEAGLGHDRILIHGVATSLGFSEAFAVDRNSVIDTGDGNDTINLHANARGDETYAWGLTDSSVETGLGHDNVTIKASTNAGALDPAYGAVNSRINLGSGTDALRISASARGTTIDTMGAFAVLGTSIDSGNDNDRIHLDATASKGSGASEAIALGHASQLTSGSGRDMITISALARGGSTTAKAVSDSAVNSGDGDDRITLKAWTTSGERNPAHGLENSSVELGEGNNHLTIGVTAQGTANDNIAAYGVMNSTIDGGDAIDRITIESKGSNHLGYNQAASLTGGSSIVTKAGNDVVMIKARSLGNGLNSDAVAVQSSSIDTGSDDDAITLHAVNENINGALTAVVLDNHSRLFTDVGHDNILLRAHSRAGDDKAWTMRNSSIDSGDGDDRLLLDGNVLNSQINTGDGEDNLWISGMDSQQVVVDAGGGDDNITFDSGSDLQLTTGAGADHLRLNRDFYTSLLNGATASAPQKDPVTIHDFTTGAGGDSFNADDIINRHAIGMNRRTAFADGYLTFQQNGLNTEFLFDADGALGSGADPVTLVVFKNTVVHDFMRDNVSTLIQQTDF